MAKKPSPEFIRRVLCTVYQLTRGKEALRTKRHVPGELIAHRFPVHDRGKVWKALKILEKEGLIERKGGTDSYMLTEEGAQTAIERCED